MRPDQKADLDSFFGTVLAPPPNLSVTEWAEQNVIIPERAGATGGPFNTRLIPYAREPLECYADKSVTDLVMVFGTQTAKTTIMICGALYRICVDPMSAVWVLPNENLAKSFSKSRWIPYIHECNAVHAHLPRSETGRVDRHRFNFLEQQFSRMNLNFVGSNSPANLASRPAGFLQLDEVDKFGEETDFEAGALDNAEERAKTFPFSLIAKASTPTTVHGGIWKEFLLTDQRHYYVPCPRCEQRIILKFHVKTEEHGPCGVRWWRESEDEVKKDGAWDMEAVRQAAFYKCQMCGGEIHEFEKPAMVEAGIWKPHNERSERGRRGYHLSSLYSLLGPKVTLGAIAVAWCQTSGFISKRHRFINSTLAETWDDERAFDDRPIFLENYTDDVLPQDRHTIMTVDFQENHFWVLVRTWARPNPGNPHGESWMLLADRIETPGEVEQIQEQFAVDGRDVVFDMAHKPTAVAKLLVEHNWRGMWGSDNKKGFVHRMDDGTRVTRIYSTVEYRDPHLGTKWQDQTAQRARFVYWSRELVLDHVFSLRHMDPPCWHMHANAHPKYQRHLNSHMKTTRYNHSTGRTTYFWKELYKGDDHLLDCECMSLVRAVQLGLLPLVDENPKAYQATMGF